MIVTISGEQEAGKTTLAKNLSRRLQCPFISIGNLRGEIAKEHGMTIDELNELGKSESWVHEEADKKTIKLGKSQDNFIIEEWAAFHFIPHSKKIFLKVDPEIDGKRIFENQRPDEPPCKNIKELKTMLKRRLVRTDEQFKKYYNINFLNEKNYNIIINTSSKTSEEVLEEAVKLLK